MQLSTRKSDLATENRGKPGARVTWRTQSKIAPGCRMWGVVAAVDRDGASVHISQALRGYVHATQCTVTASDADLRTLSQEGAAGLLQVGDVIRCGVLTADSATRRLNLTLRDTIVNGGDAAPQLVESYRAPGSVIVVRVGGLRDGMRVVNQPAAGLQVDRSMYGRVCVTHVRDAATWRSCANSDKKAKRNSILGGALRVGDFLRAVVLPTSVGKQLDLSLRPSLVHACAKAAAKRAGSAKETLDAMLKKTDARIYKAGDTVRGFVASTSTKAGVFVRLSPHVVGRVMLKNLADGFVEDVNGAFPRGALVEAKVLSSQGSGDRLRIELSLKQSALSGVGIKDAKHTLSSLEMGQKLTGFVRKVESFGVFVNLADSGSPPLSGLAHISECADEFVKDLTQIYKPGDRVRVKVIKVDEAKKRLSLGLKASYFQGDMMDEDGGESDEDV